MKRKLVDVSGGKKVLSTLDFCKIYDGLDVEKKAGVIKNLQKTLDTGTTFSGKTKLKEGEHKAVKQLIGWCQVNMMVGNELCPPEYLSNY